MREICHERRIPALLVTHDPDATRFVDRVHTLRDGHLDRRNGCGRGSDHVVRSIVNPRIAGVRLSMLLHLYAVRLRSHAVQELLAGSGIAVGVALVLGVLVANSSLTSSARRCSSIASSARRSWSSRRARAGGFDEALARAARALPAVAVAAPALRENVALAGHRRARRGAAARRRRRPSTALGGLDTRDLGGFHLAGGLAPARAASRARSAPKPARRSPCSPAAPRSRSGSRRCSAARPSARSPRARSCHAAAERTAPHRPAGRVSEVLIKPRAGAAGEVARELQSLAAGRIDVVPADNELRLLDAGRRARTTSRRRCSPRSA